MNTYHQTNSAGRVESNAIKYDQDSANQATDMYNLQFQNLRLRPPVSDGDTELGMYTVGKRFTGDIIDAENVISGRTAILNRYSTIDRISHRDGFTGNLTTLDDFNHSTVASAGVVGTAARAMRDVRATQQSSEVFRDGSRISADPLLNLRIGRVEKSFDDRINLDMDRSRDVLIRTPESTRRIDAILQDRSMTAAPSTDVAMTEYYNRLSNGNVAQRMVVGQMRRA